MIGVGKHIDSLYTFHAVTGTQNDRQFSPKRVRITGNVNCNRRHDTVEDTRQDGLGTALSRWVKDHRIPAFTPQSHQCLFHTAGYKPYAIIWNPVEAQVRFRIFDSLSIFVNASNAGAGCGEWKTKQPASAIQIENTRCTVETFDDALLEHSSRENICLEKCGRRDKETQTSNRLAHMTASMDPDRFRTDHERAGLVVYI